MSQTARNLELDRLRGVAALMTLFTHYRQVFYPWTFSMEYTGPSSALDMLSNAWTGVDLFFVISGYIISKTIVSSFDRSRHGESPVSSLVVAFYIRRFFLIYPVAWLIILGIIGAAAWLNDGGYFGSVVAYLRGSISVFTYSFNYWYADNKVPQLVPMGPYWSLSVEEQFYLLYPLFLLTITTTRRRVGALLAALIVITLCIRPLSAGNVLHQFFYTQSRCDGLIYGCLLYFASVQPWFEQLRRCVADGGWIMKGVMVLIAVAIAGLPTIGFGPVAVVPIACILSTILVAVSACEVGAISFPVPIQRLMDFAGRRSYTIYLIHVPLFYLTCELLYRYCAAVGIQISAALKPEYLLTFAVLMLMGTELVHRLVERPLIRHGQSVAARVMGSDTSSVASPARHVQASNLSAALPGSVTPSPPAR
jgi:peptidoglycan/LPS O-acetylase OafA/YrhL